VGAILGELSNHWEAQIEAIKQLEINGDLSEAEDAGKILLEHMEGDRTHLLELLGDICIKRKHYRRAADYYLQAKEVSDVSEAKRYLVIAADAYYCNKDYTLAAAIYWERYRLEADDEILFRYGTALLHGNTWKETEPLAFQNKRIQAKFDWNCAADAYRENDLEKACRYLRPWIEEGILGLSACYFYAQVQYRLGNMEEAQRLIEFGRHYYIEESGEKYYEKLLQLQLRIAIERGDRKIAEGIESLLGEKESHDMGKILLEKVMGLRAIGRYGEALAILEELGCYLPDEARYLRGEIYLESGRGVGGALEVFKELGKGVGRMGYIGCLREADLECYLGNFSRAEKIYEEMQRAIEGADWMEQKEMVREYLEKKIIRSKLGQGQAK
jgi:hypothetical protein